MSAAVASAVDSLCAISIQHSIQHTQPPETLTPNTNRDCSPSTPSPCTPESSASSHSSTSNTSTPSTSTTTSPTTTATSAPPTDKSITAFRNYHDSARQSKVSTFYEQQHTQQTVTFVESMHQKYLSTVSHFELGIWEALEFLDTFVDDSDPDTENSQLQHALQTAEAIRSKYPDEQEYGWFHLTGLIHDIGKILSIACHEPQWAVVGDTFPVGCAFTDANVFPHFFANNSDSCHPIYSSELGIYSRNCGLENVRMSFGHDEYLYRVIVGNKSTLPISALYAIRFHSFYPWHKQGGYKYLTNEQDEKMLYWVKEFNQFDLYSKAKEKMDVEKLKPYYQKLIKKYFPEKLKW